MEKSCELHQAVMKTPPAHQQMNLRIWCKCPFEPVNKPRVVRSSQPVNQLHYSGARGWQPGAGPHGRSRCPGDTSSLCVSLPASARNGAPRFDLSPVRTSCTRNNSRSRAQKLPAERRDAPCRLNPCKTPLFSTQLPETPVVSREGRMKPCNVMRRVCSEQPGVGKGQLVLSPCWRLSEQLLETKLTCLVSATVFRTAREAD